MTDLGRETFEHSYDDLALSALKFIANQNSENSVKAFADQRALDIENRGRALVESALGITEKGAALAHFLTDEGFAATVTDSPMGLQLCQNHCPVAHVAAQFPELCESETQALSRLVGTHVQRLATIAHGDGVCTTFIPKLSHNPSQKSSENLSSEKIEIGAHA
jgi:predicted ArsR family transcriptional regulator